MLYAYLLAIVAAGNSFFYLIHNVSAGDLVDLGLCLIFLGLIYQLLYNKNLGVLANFFTWFVFLYLLLVLAQVSVASLNYSQSIKDGLIAVRHQFYYLAFPLFLLTLNDLEKINRFMSLLTGLAIVIIVLSVINYFGITLFSYFLAEGQGIRGGIVRAYVPALEILVMTAIWNFNKYIEENRLFDKSLLLFCIICLGILLRQTRGHILPLFAVIMMMLFIHRRFKTMAGVGLFVLALLIGLSFTLEQNPLVNLFVSTVDDLSIGSDVKGLNSNSWNTRIVYFNNQLPIFLDNFWTGSGGVAIRNRGEGWTGWGNLFWVAFNVDLGYWVWLKFYGFPGIVLMASLIFNFYWRVKKTSVAGERRTVLNFATYSFTCILISTVTEVYFTRPGGTMILCLLFAILVNAERSRLNQDETPVPAVLHKSPAESPAG